jgi:hypothetical protein
MNLSTFLDELTKLGAIGGLPLNALMVKRRVPLHSVRALVRGALAKRAEDLSVVHDEIAPTAIEVNPGDASTRSPDGGKAPSTIIPGALGGITPSADPIDRERFNRVWNSLATGKA